MEDYRYLFVGDIPLLYEKERIAKQIQVETWLDLAQACKELGIEKVEPVKIEEKPVRIEDNSKGYVV